MAATMVRADRKNLNAMVVNCERMVIGEVD
jgi:hypothetical protein